MAEIKATCKDTNGDLNLIQLEVICNEVAGLANDLTERIEDIAGAVFTDSNSVDVTYDDSGNTLAADVIVDDSTIEIDASNGVQVKDDGITLAKMADLAQGSVIVGGASDAPTALDAKTDTQILIGDGTDLNSVAVSGDITIDNAGAATIASLAVETGMIALDAIDNTLIADDAVSVEHLDDGILPSHITKYAGEVTWSGGGATLAATVAGVLDTDIVIASIHTLGSEGTILQGAYASAADTITFTLDAANTSNDTVISYMVLRAAA